MQVKGRKISFQFEPPQKKWKLDNNINNAIKTTKKTLTSTAKKFPRLQIYLKMIVIYENKYYMHVFNIFCRTYHFCTQFQHHHHETCRYVFLLPSQRTYSDLNMAQILHTSIYSSIWAHHCQLGLLLRSLLDKPHRNIPTCYERKLISIRSKLRCNYTKTISNISITCRYSYPAAWTIF